MKKMLTSMLSIVMFASISAGIRDGLLFYAPFENGTEPEFVSGAKASVPEKSKSEEGRVGCGIKVEKNGIAYNNAANINMRRGTAAMFFKSDVDFNTLKTSLNFIRAEHMTVCYQPKGRMYFMTGKFLEGTGFKWDYSLETSIPRSWKAGEWHHIAMQWDYDAGERSLWLDGKCIKTVKNRHMPGGITPNALLYFGQGAPGTVDEIFIHETVLSPTTLAALAIHPENAAGELRSVHKIQKKIAASSLGFDIKSVRPIKTIVNPGEEFQADICPFNTGSRPFDSEIVFTLRDYRGNDLGSFKRKLKLAPGEKTSFRIPLKTMQRGAFKLEAAWKDDAGKLKKSDTASFAVWEKRQKPDPDSFFGNHVNGWSNGAYFEQADRLGQNWMRNHNMVQTTWWSRVCPEPGKYLWNHDFQFNSMKKFGMPLLGQLFTTPYWAVQKGIPSKKTDGYNECKMPDLQKFDEYVFETVTHYKKEIRHWEIWNEPEVGMFFKGSPEEFAELVQTALKAAKRADPSATVMAAGWTYPGWGWQKRAAQAGAFKGLDAISFHYGTTDEAPEIYWKKFEDTLNHFQSLAVKYGNGKPLPVWNTEGGCSNTTFFEGLDYPFLPPFEKRIPLNSAEAAVTVVKGTAVQIALGVKKHFIYLQNPPARNSASVYLNTSMLDLNNAPKPLLMSRVAMQEQLDYTKFTGIRKEIGNRFMGLVFQKNKFPDESIVLLWTGKNGKLEFDAASLGKIIKKVDLMGNDVPFSGSLVTVEETPFYLHVKAPAKQLLSAFNKIPFRILSSPEKIEIATDKDTHGIPALPDYVTPQENPAGVFTVDLRKFCNMGFADEKAGDGKGGWADEGDLNDLRALKTGKQTFYGVPFDIIDPNSNNGKSIITLQGLAVTKSFPKEIKGIPLNRAPWKLYFLQSSSWGGRGNIGEYVLHFEDGSQEIVKMNIPLNNNNWWSGYHKDEISRPIPVRVTNTINGKPAWRYLRVFEWENLKRKKIRSIDIRSASEHSTPIVIAISGV